MCSYLWYRNHHKHLHEIVEGLYYHCSLFVCVCMSGSTCEQKSSQTDAPIWTRFLLNDCFLHWLGPCWNWWPCVKGQGHSDSISIFSSWFSFNFPTVYLSSLMSVYISALLCLIKLNFGMPLWYVFCRIVLEFHKNQMMDDVMVTSYKFTSYKCPYFKFY